MTQDEEQYFKNHWFRDAEHLMQEKSVNKLMQDYLSLQEDIRLAEEGNVPMYCPECTSCGEAGCCSPDSCKAVRCLYESSNLRSYYEAQLENSILWKLMEMLQGIQEERIVAGKEIKEWADQAEKEIHDIWSKEYGDLETFFKKTITKNGEKSAS